MRIALLGAVLLAGCAMTPEQMSQKSNWDVCRLSMTPAQGQVAHGEAMRRGLDCQPYYPAIQAQQANENAAVQNFLRATQPAPRAPAQPPSSVMCRTVRAGDTLQTHCF